MAEKEVEGATRQELIDKALDKQHRKGFIGQRLH